MILFKVIILAQRVMVIMTKVANYQTDFLVQFGE